jgi:hypothetical protein
VRSADIALDDGGEHVEEIYTGGCLTTLRTDDGADPVSTTRCDGTIEPAPPANGRSAEPSRVDRLTGWQTLGRAFPTFVVQERNGRWYISPVRSVLTTFGEVLQHLQPADVGALADRLAWAWDLYALPDAPDTRN